MAKVRILGALAGLVLGFGLWWLGAFLSSPGYADLNLSKSSSVSRPQPSLDQSNTTSHSSSVGEPLAPRAEAESRDVASLPPSEAADAVQPIAREDLSLLRAAMRAPHRVDASRFASSSLFNPRSLQISAELQSQSEDLVLRYKALESVEKEALAVRAAELAELEQSGEAAVVPQGQSPWGKFGNDVTFTKSLGGGPTVVAPNAKMVKTKAAYAPLEKGAKDMLADLAGLYLRNNVLNMGEYDRVMAILRDWEK